MNNIKCLQKTLGKRIKRHIIGRSKNFFAATPPNFESLCKKEIENILPDIKDIHIENGGVKFSGKIHDCYFANLKLSVANKILIRILKFKASNLRQFEKKIFTIEWELYLPENLMCSVNVTTKTSRIYHKGAVSEYILKSIDIRKSTVFFKKTDNIKSNSMQIFVRIIDDKCTISLDTSGDLLHKRGIKKHKASAPVRGTIASSILAISGYDPEKPLVDPMCGSGTFAIEAALKQSKIPAGWNRDFAFMDWPCFSEKRWLYIKKKEAEKISLLKSANIFSSDINKERCKEFKDQIKNFAFQSVIKIDCLDFFLFSPKQMTSKKGLVVINPPYGHRMGSKTKSRKLFQGIFKKLNMDYQGWKFAIIIPKYISVKKDFKVYTHSFSHGGLTLNLFYGKV
jgi:putative N6-adenine-specific DNA methylase